MADSAEKSKFRRNKTNRKISQEQPVAAATTAKSTHHSKSNNHVLKKRPATKPLQRENDIYVTNKSNFEAQLQKCKSILNDQSGEVFLHCIGNAIRRGINLALTLVNDSDNGFAYEANTSTIELVDDFHPLNDDEDFAIQSRLNSCLHIRIYRRSLAITSTGPKQQ